jgi:hypothetical protein
MPAHIVDTNFTLLKLGAIAVGGYADGEAIAHDFDDVDWVLEKGSHGEVTAVKKHNGGSTLTFRLMQGNALIPLIKALFKTGRSFIFQFADLHADTVISSNQAIGEKIPKEAWGDSGNPYEFVVKVVNAKSVGGANQLL